MPTDSILNSVKEALGIVADDRSFDNDVIMHINSVFSTLTQLGVGPLEGYAIADAEDKWVDFLETKVRLNAVKSYVVLQVRLWFDPPDNYFVVKSLEETLAKMDFRLNIIAEEIAAELLAELEEMVEP